MADPIREALAALIAELRANKGFPVSTPAWRLIEQAEAALALPPAVTICVVCAAKAGHEESMHLREAAGILRHTLSLLPKLTSWEAAWLERDQQRPSAAECNCRSATMGSTRCTDCQHDLGCPVHNAKPCSTTWREANQQRPPAPAEPEPSEADAAKLERVHSDVESYQCGWAAATDRAQEETTRLLALDQPWPLPDTLTKLAEAANILLLEKNYDGHGWELIGRARLDALAAVDRIRHFAQPKTADAPEPEGKPAWEQDVTKRLREERDHYRELALTAETDIRASVARDLAAYNEVCAERNALLELEQLYRKSYSTWPPAVLVIAKLDALRAGTTEPCRLAQYHNTVSVCSACGRDPLYPIDALRVEPATPSSVYPKPAPATLGPHSLGEVPVFINEALKVDREILVAAIERIGNMSHGPVQSAFLALAEALKPLAVSQGQ